MQRQNTNRLHYENNKKYCLQAVGDHERCHLDNVVKLQAREVRQQRRETDQPLLNTHTEISAIKETKLILFFRQQLLLADLHQVLHLTNN